MFDSWLLNHMCFNRNVFMKFHSVIKNALVIHLILQVLSFVSRCIRPLGSIASTCYTKTKHQLSTTNLCETKVSSYNSLSNVRWFTTITRLGTSYWQGNNFQNNQRNNQRNMGSFERGLFKANSEVEDWKAISKEFENLWNFPHCIGAINRKHVAIECPKLSGTQYFNYKSFFSVVLLAICNAKYCFTYVDFGQYGSTNDSSVLRSSDLYKVIEENKFNVSFNRTWTVWRSTALLSSWGWDIPA